MILLKKMLQDALILNLTLIISGVPIIKQTWQSYGRTVEACLKDYFENYIDISTKM